MFTELCNSSKVLTDLSVSSVVDIPHIRRPKLNVRTDSRQACILWCNKLGTRESENHIRLVRRSWLSLGKKKPTDTEND